MRTIFTTAAGLAVITASGSTQGQQTLDTIDPASIEARGGGFLSTQGSFTLSGGSAAGRHFNKQIQDSMSFVERTSAEKTHAENQRKKMGLRKGQQMDTIVKGRGGGFLSTTGSFTLSGGAPGQR